MSMNVTDYELEKRTGVDSGNISKHRRALRGDRVSVPLVRKLADGMGIRPCWLAFGEGPMLEDDHVGWVRHPLDVAIRFNGGRFSPDAIATVKAWRDAHPDEDMAPRQWEVRLLAAQRAITDGAPKESDSKQ